MSLKKNSSKKQKILFIGILFLILLFGVGLRFFRIDNLRLTQDEMSIGYNAFSIAETGKDEWGRSYPLAFQAFGDWKLPAYIYAAVPFIKFFGFNELSVKAPSILAGSALIVVLYLLVKKISKNPWYGLLAALFTAVSPWSLQLSRMALESNLALFFFTTGLFFFLQAVEKKRRFLLFSLLSGIFFGLSLYSYIAYRLYIISFLFASWLLTFIWKKPKKILLLSSISLFLTIVPLLPQFFNQAGTARFQQIGIFSDQGIVSQVNERRSSCYLIEKKFLPKICTFFFHKPQALLNNFSINYFSFLSPTFLFLKGDTNKYLNDPGFAEFNWLLLPFYAFGLYSLLKNKDFVKQLVFIGFLLAPIPSALVGEPQIVRGSMLLPFVIVLCTLGVQEFFLLKIPRHIRTCIAVIISGLFAFFSGVYLLHALIIYPQQNAIDFFPISKEATLSILDKKGNYDTVYVNSSFSDAHILLAFYGKFDPSWYQTEIIRPQSDSLGFQHPTQIGKFIFGEEKGLSFLCHPELRLGKMLYVSNGGESLPATETFKNFSQVHTEVQLLDIEVVDKTLSQESRELYCQTGM